MRLKFLETYFREDLVNAFHELVHVLVVSTLELRVLVARQGLDLTDQLLLVFVQLIVQRLPYFFLFFLAFFYVFLCDVDHFVEEHLRLEALVVRRILARKRLDLRFHAEQAAVRIEQVILFCSQFIRPAFQLIGQNIVDIKRFIASVIRIAVFALLILE